MYKKYATLFLLYNMVLFMAWISTKGIIKMENKRNMGFPP